jgi:hypothetical protein
MVPCSMGDAKREAIAGIRADALAFFIPRCKEFRAAESSQRYPEDEVRQACRKSPTEACLRIGRILMLKLPKMAAHGTCGREDDLALGMRPMNDAVDMLGRAHG